MSLDNKTPRDWLLSRHTSATPKLDALRCTALPEPSIAWRDLLRELFRPHRTAWRLLAVVWVALALFHLAQLDPAHGPKANTPSPEAVALWLTQLKSHETFAQIDRHP